MINSAKMIKIRMYATFIPASVCAQRHLAAIPDRQRDLIDEVD